jgi:hypothetical protein
MQRDQVNHTRARFSLAMLNAICRTDTKLLNGQHGAQLPFCEALIKRFGNSSSRRTCHSSDPVCTRLLFQKSFTRLDPYLHTRYHEVQPTKYANRAEAGTFPSWHHRLVSRFAHFDFYLHQPSEHKTSQPPATNSSVTMVCLHQPLSFKLGY